MSDIPENAELFDLIEEINKGNGENH
jgi:hypothetical protein